MSLFLRMFIALIFMMHAADRVWAESLIQFTQRAAKAVTTVGGGTTIWSFEDRNPNSSTYGQEFVFVRLEPMSTWRIRRIGRRAQGPDIFSAHPSYDYHVSVQGGFFDTFEGGTEFRPVGLVISNGTRLSTFEP